MEADLPNEKLVREWLSALRYLRGFCYALCNWRPGAREAAGH
jgi:hypothetical protein